MSFKNTNKKAFGQNSLLNQSNKNKSLQKQRSGKLNTQREVVSKKDFIKDDRVTTKEIEVNGD